MRKTISTATPAVLLPAALLLGGCGGSSTDAGPAAGSTSSAGASSSPGQGPVINVTVKGNDITPNGDRVDAKVGEPVTINVTTTATASCTCTPRPSRSWTYSKGKTTLHVTVDTPGVVDIEDHIADVVVVQLQVS